MTRSPAGWILGLVLTSAVATASVALLTASLGTDPAVIGETVTVTIGTDPTITDGTPLFVVCGTAPGATVIELAKGVTVTVPVAGTVWIGARTKVGAFDNDVAAWIPLDHALANHQLFCCVVAAPVGAALVTARIGGPIIQDAIF